METKDIKTIMELFAKLPLNEMKIESGEQTLFLAKHANPPIMSCEQPVTVSATLPTTETPIPVAEDPGLHYVTSPIVGTFYTAPNPKAAVFVKKGDQIQNGQVLCIIEAMKLMNEIQSEVSGEVVEIFVQNAQPVEYGQKLFSIKK